MIIRIVFFLSMTGVICSANLAPEPEKWITTAPVSAFQKKMECGTVLGVRGKGDDSAAWHTSGLKLDPASTYMMRFRSSANGAGTIISGLENVNRDFEASATPSINSFAFRVPDKDAATVMRLGHWNLKGEVVFDKIELYPVKAIHRCQGDMVLGDGERIEGGIYTDTHSMNWRGSTIHRTLCKQKARFNSSRWCFGRGDEIIYKHVLPVDMLSGEVRINVSYHTAGSLVINVSKDGKDWVRVSEVTKQDSVEAKLPAGLFPAREIYVQIQGEGDRANLQVDAYTFRAGTKETSNYTGRTVLVEERMITPGLRVTLEGVDGGIMLHWFNLVDSARNLDLQVEAGGITRSSCSVRVPANGEAFSMVVMEPVMSAQKQRVTCTDPLSLPAGVHPVRIAASDGKSVVCEWGSEIKCNVLSESAYGKRCDGKVPGLSAWWCESAWKVGAQRGIPAGRPARLLIEAARGEYEAVQLVLNAEDGERTLQSVDAGELKCGRARIPASAVSIFEVATARVENPSDYLGEPGDYPDPLPPLVVPKKLSSCSNQALWVLVHVPDDAKAGDYRGEVKVKTDLGEGRIKVQLHVFDFAMPRETHLRSGFGLSPHMIKRYHQLKNREQELVVYEKYLQSFAEHRIAPYSFSEYSPLKVSFEGKDKDRRVVIDWTAFDVAARKYLDNGMFNAFMLHISGLGGGTFFERHAGEFGGFKAGTVDYERLWGDYARQLESHLSEKGWLKHAYVYWFDEPDKKDYEFVNEGMDRIKKYAPGLTRLLTEQVEPELTGHVDLWCALTPHWTPKLVQERRAAGEEVWWYICCGPKAPYIGEFTEHPAAEMRIWPWQSWQYGVQGILIWETTYWTSSTAFTNSLQDPWLDAMAYVSGYGVKPGSKQFWGNCDGRYLYPPRRDPNQAHEPCLDGPISSLRWENLRDGMDDYEYFYMLKQQIERARGKAGKKLIAEAEKLLVVPENISKDTTHFTFDIRPVMEQRRKIAGMIEKLQRY
ncbi:MAG: hypothetical protein A2283_00530 [Lentisphaerae bacterium RIFOXYA12_FULL_48_11]|nr:MAG: hypothetical protein A2283_00530 [Lentisphaerae bacterium RIFOXYA12_FULL_48_11]